MRSKKNPVSSKNNIVALSVAVSLLIIGGVVYYIFLYRASYDPTTNYQPEYPASVNDNSQDNTVKEKQAGGSDTNTPSEKVPVSETGTVAITNLNQKDGYVNALAEVTDFIVSQCVYSFTSDGSKPVVREQSDGCSGVSIPQEEFDKIGNYTLTVSVYSVHEKLTTTKDIYVR